MARKYDSVIFDLDGTLTDSGPGIMRCAAAAMDELNVSFDRSAESLRVFVGPPLSKIFAEFGVPADQVEKAITIYREHYVKGGGKYENIPYDSIRGLLERLRKDGCRLYVATTKPEGLSVDILDHFELSSCFDVIAGATIDHSREKKADILRYLLEQIKESGTEASRVVMIGDTVFDVEGAAALGIPCIGVSWGYGSVEEMERAGACGIAHTMDELYELL